MMKDSRNADFGFFAEPSSLGWWTIDPLNRHSVGGGTDWRTDTVARITVEDCLKRVNNRFLLVNMVAKRVRQIREGSEYLVSSPKNEDIVVGLREIAAGKVSLSTGEEIEAPPKEEAPALEAAPVTDAAAEGEEPVAEGDDAVSEEAPKETPPEA